MCTCLFLYARSFRVVTPSARPTATPTSSSSTHTPVPRYSGSGDLLTGYCVTPDYTLVDGGATAYYAPFVGCDGDKLDCCPFTPVTAVDTSTVTAPITITETVGAGGSASSNGDSYPTAADAGQ